MNTTTKPTIKRIIIKHILDDSPDTSWIGEYTDDLGPGVIIRDYDNFYEKLPAPMDRDVNGRFVCKGEPSNLPPRGRECRGFKPYAGGEPRGTKNYYRYGMCDWELMRGLERGDWCFIGIQAVAVIRIGGVMQQVVSGGLWGIESNNKPYIAEIEDAELSELRELLSQLGIDWDNSIDIEYKD